MAGERISFIKNYDQDNGYVDFGTPSKGMRSVCSTHLLNYHTGAELTCWCGGYAKDSVAILVCFAMNGYHSLVQYKWYHDKREMVENTYPAKETGMYECISMGTGVHKSQLLVCLLQTHAFPIMYKFY